MPRLLRSLLLTLAVVFFGGAAVGACGDDDGTTTTTAGAADAADQADAADAAAAFCGMYDDTCGFGNAFGGDTYADLADCTTRFDGYVASRRACVTQHLGFAAAGGAATHCPHAEGADPCD